LTQGFWQAWREQVGKSPRLAHLLLQRGRQLLERFQHFYTTLGRLSRPAQLRWQHKLGASLAGVALTLALSSAPVAHAFPPRHFRSAYQRQQLRPDRCDYCRQHRHGHRILRRGHAWRRHD